MTIYEKVYEIGMEDLKNGDMVVFFRENNTIYHNEIKVDNLEHGFAEVKEMVRASKKKPNQM